MVRTAGSGSRCDSSLQPVRHATATTDEQTIANGGRCMRTLLRRRHWKCSPPVPDVTDDPDPLTPDSYRCRSEAQIRPPFWRTPGLLSPDAAPLSPAGCPPHSGTAFGRMTYDDRTELGGRKRHNRDPARGNAFPLKGFAQAAAGCDDWMTP